MSKEIIMALTPAEVKLINKTREEKAKKIDEKVETNNLAIAYLEKELPSLKDFLKPWNILPEYGEVQSPRLFSVLNSRREDDQLIFDVVGAKTVSEAKRSPFYVEYIKYVLPQHIYGIEAYTAGSLVLTVGVCREKVISFRLSTYGGIVSDNWWDRPLQYSIDYYFIESNIIKFVKKSTDEQASIIKQWLFNYGEEYSSYLEEIHQNSIKSEAHRSKVMEALGQYYKVNTTTESEAK